MIINPFKYDDKVNKNEFNFYIWFNILVLISVSLNDSCCHCVLVVFFLIILFFKISVMKSHITNNIYVIFLMVNNVFGLLLFLIVLYQSYLFYIFKWNNIFETVIV